MIEDRPSGRQAVIGSWQRLEERLAEVQVRRGGRWAWRAATLIAAATLIGQPPRPARSRAAAVIIRMLWAPTVFGWIVLLSPAALADRTTVQLVPCEPGPERRLAVDGSVSACRLAAAADLLVDPAGGNGKVPCAAGSAVEFHRNGATLTVTSMPRWSSGRPWKVPATGTIWWMSRPTATRICQTHLRQYLYYLPPEWVDL